MKYRWIKPTLATKKRDIESLLGKSVKEIKTGDISEEGGSFMQGIEIEVDEALSGDDLKKLDKRFDKLVRKNE